MHPLIIQIISIVLFVAAGNACAGQDQFPAISKEQIRAVLKSNPELVLEALKGHEEQLYDLMQIGLEKKNKAKIRERRRAELENPKIADLQADRPVWGNPDGKIHIIAFSDFQSATCAKADQTIELLLKKHPEISYRFRHNPLNLHKMSIPAAQYYEALALQDHLKAMKLNRLILQNRFKIKKQGIKKLDELAEKCGADMKRLHSDLKSTQVSSVIERDIKEARKLGLTASPVFLVNGLTVTGAVPAEEFEEVFRMLLNN